MVATLTITEHEQNPVRMLRWAPACHHKGQTRLVVDVWPCRSASGAPEAQLLYAETEASKTQREEIALRRKAMAAGIMAPSSTQQKDRRELTRLQRQENS